MGKALPNRLPRHYKTERNSRLHIGGDNNCEASVLTVNGLSTMCRLKRFMERYKKTIEWGIPLVYMVGVILASLVYKWLSGE